VDQTKSELYQSFLPRLNAKTVELLDDERSIKQLLALERRTSRGGRDSIDHPSGAKDDVANALAGVAHELRQGQAVVAAIVADDVQSFRDELRRCAEADAERLRNGEQDDYLRSQGTPVCRNWRDKYFGSSR
jgi:hypothetical protein